VEFGIESSFENIHLLTCDTALRPATKFLPAAADLTHESTD